MAGKKTDMVYEIRVGGNVVAQFSSERKAKGELAKLKRAGVSGRIYSKWVENPTSAKVGPVPKKKTEKKPKAPAKKTVKPSVASNVGGKATQNTSINEWLVSKGYEPVERDMTFQDLYSAIVVQQRLMEEAVGECEGRKNILIKGIVEAMDASVVTERLIRNVLENMAKRQSTTRTPAELWIAPLELEVMPDAASELEMYWQSVQEPFFIGTYRNGDLCDPEARTSDLSIQPAYDGPRLCYRETDNDRVYTIVGSIDDIRIDGHRLRIKGRSRYNAPLIVNLPLKRSKTKTNAVSKDFREGWYVVNGRFLLFVQRSEEPLAGSDRMYDYYVDYTAVYPGFRTYATDGGLIAFSESDGFTGFLKTNFRMADARYIAMNDPWELREAFEEYDYGAICRISAEHPELSVIDVGGK